MDSEYNCVCEWCGIQESEINFNKVYICYMCYNAFKMVTERPLYVVSNETKQVGLFEWFSVVTC